MQTKSTVGLVFITLISLSVINAAPQLCTMVFTSEPRKAFDLPETRPYLIQVPGESIRVFYDDLDSINVQPIDGPAGAIQFYSRDLKDTRTFSVTNYKDNTPVYMTFLDRNGGGVRTVVSEFPFDTQYPGLHTASMVEISSLQIPSAVAASKNNIAFVWPSTDSQPQTLLQLTRSINGGSSFTDRALKRTPTWAALTYVKNDDIYGAPTFLGVYQDESGESNLFRFAADNVDSDVTEVPIELEGNAETLSYLSIAAYNKRAMFAVTGQLSKILEDTLLGVSIFVLDARFDSSASVVIGKKIIPSASKPSLYITEYDELFVSYKLPDNSTCLEVYEDFTLGTPTMSWCSDKSSVDPGWSGITADTRGGYVAITSEDSAKSVIGVYKCDFGCGNGMVSPNRGEQCDGGAYCSGCVCASGTIPRSPPGLGCVVPPVPAPSQSPVPTINQSPPPPTSVAPLVVPILDCYARLNQTHFRTYLSYKTLTEGVPSVTVPIGEQNRFTNIAPNQGQPTTFRAGQSKLYNTAVDISSGQPVSWILTKYRLNIAEAEANRCPSDITFSIGITSPTPPSETVINATIDYVAWVFNVSNNNVSVNVTQTQQNQFDLTVTVQVPPAALVAAIEDVRDILEDTTSLEEHIKDVDPEIVVNGVRGQPTGVDNPATFIEDEPIAPDSSSHQLIALTSVLALTIVPLL